MVRTTVGWASFVMLAVLIGSSSAGTAAEVAPVVLPSTGPVSAAVLTNTVLQKVSVPLSKFVTEPAYGRDPFFPASKRRIEPDATIAEPVPVPEPKPEPSKMVNVRNPGKLKPSAEPEDDSLSYLSIKGILATARSRNVTLHTTVRSYLFRSGDEILLRVPDGKLRVRCLEIRDGSAVFKLTGRPEPVELFLQSGMNR